MDCAERNRISQQWIPQQHAAAAARNTQAMTEEGGGVLASGEPGTGEVDGDAGDERHQHSLFEETFSVKPET